MSNKTSVQRMRDRIMRRADLRDWFGLCAPEDQERLKEIQRILRDQGRAMRREYLRALELEVKVIFQKIAKVVPDEKIIEHELGDNIIGAMTDAELDGRIIELVRKAGIVRAAATEGETPPAKPH